MVERVKAWLAAGREVRIFTARVHPLNMVMPNDSIVHHLVNPIDRIRECAQSATAIRLFCARHLGKVLPITCIKDWSMDELYDDRAVQVIKNTGELVGVSTRGL
jgi:hypothetical protein